MPTGRRAAASGLTAAAAWTALVFWVYYAVLRQVAGPLGPDETGFAHMIWLVSQGKRQYIDFYSHHLPTYFWLLKPLVGALSASSADLSFILVMRALSALIILWYVGLVWKLHRIVARQTGLTGLAAAVTVLLVFVVQARMVEVRTDTIGLLLVNTAWAVVLLSPVRSRMLVAAFLAGLAILFSARAAAMGGIMGITLLFLAGRSRDRAGVRALLALAGGFVAAGGLLYLAAPDWVATVIRYCFQDARLPVQVSLLQRYVLPDRLPCTLLIVAGLAGGIRMARTGQPDRGFLVAAACGGQLLMIAIDPNPFSYVFGWAALPAVLGLLLLSRAAAAAFPLALALAVAALSFAYATRHGQEPPALSPYRLSYDPPIDPRALERLPTPELVSLLVDDRHQKGLLNYLHVRSEVCRRLQGRLLASFDTHPVCLHDTMYDFAGMRWPALQQGDVPPWGAISAQEFEAQFQRDRPVAFIWAHRWEPPRPLLPGTRRMLECCYDIYDGFAIAKEVPPGK